MKNDNIRKLTVTGKTSTYYVTLPKDVIHDLKWKKGQKLIVEKKGKQIIIKDWE